MRSLHLAWTPLLASVAALALVAMPGAVGAQSGASYSTLAVFQPGDPTNPLSILVEARDGNLYGTSTGGGTSGRGTVFRLTPDGKVTIMHSFAGPDGCMSPLASLIDQPNNGLTLGTDGSLYGIAVCSEATGVFFKIATDGTFTMLHAFRLSEDGGALPGAPVQAGDGNFYAFSSKDDFGDLYRMTPSGELTTLYAFKSAGDPNLFNPERLWLGSDGNLYGYSGGYEPGLGALFKASLQGDVSVVHNFEPPEPMRIDAPLDESNDSNYYGASYSGPAVNGFGTIFKLSPAGDSTTLFTFHETDGLGRLPSTALIQATDGNLYGGASGPPVLFKATPDGTYTVVHRFNGRQDGLGGPFSGFVQHTNGALYATTYEGGSQKCVGGCGGVYSLNIGAGPFMRFLPAQSNATPGHTVGVLGQGLSGATGVAFNGTPAQFTVISDTYLETTVPDKATTGPITVILGRSTLTSNRTFHVVPPPPPPTPTPAPVTEVAPTATPSTAGDASPPAAPTDSAPTQPDDVPPPSDTPPADVSPPAELSDSDRADILAAVDRANAAWARAKATLDITGLSDAVAGQELAIDIAEVQKLEAAGQLQKSVNTDFLVRDVTLDAAGHGVVHTRESWSAEIDDAATRGLVRRLAPATYSETYVLEHRPEGEWIVIENDL